MGMRSEIGMRADHHHAQVGADAHGTMSFATCSPRRTAGVLAVRCEVGQALVGRDLDLDIRILWKQPLQRRPQDRMGRVLAGGDADRAAGLVAQFAKGGDLALNLLEGGGEGFQQALSASVGATLRVVRTGRRRPNRVSSR